MGFKNMNVAQIEVGPEKVFAYEQEVDLDSVTESDWILIPKGVSDVAYVLSVGGGGKGKVQITTDSVATVKSGSQIAIDWPAGEVAANTSDSSVPITAVRLNQTFAGTTKLTVRAQ